MATNARVAKKPTVSEKVRSEASVVALTSIKGVQVVLELAGTSGWCCVCGEFLYEGNFKDSGSLGIIARCLKCGTPYWPTIRKKEEFSPLMRIKKPVSTS